MLKSGRTGGPGRQTAGAHRKTCPTLFKIGRTGRTKTGMFIQSGLI